MKFEIGDILCYKNNAKWYNFFKSKYNFAMFMIKIGTFSEYVHIGGIVDVDYSNPDYNEQVIVGQALQNFDIRGQHFYIDTLLKEGKLLVKRYPGLTKEQKNIIREEAYKIQGVDYDWKGILLISIYLLTGKTLFKDNANKFFCSEAWDYLYKKVKIKLFNKKSRNVYPADFAETNKLLIVKE